MELHEPMGAARPKFLPTLRLGLRMMWRDARAGELRLLILALVVAVAAVSSVGFLADRVGRALERDASQMLGADLLLEADEAIPDAFLQHARELGLLTSITMQFPSMAGAADEAQLVSLKAVEPGYPLRGNLRVADTLFGPQAITQDVPEPGTVWVDGQILSLLHLNVGDSLDLGDARFRIARLITYEPDRGMQFVNVAPRVMLRMSDLPATGLVAPGSRIGYALLVAGQPEAMAQYADWLKPALQRGQKVATLESGRPELRRTLDRAQRFLSLVALLAVLISAVAVALAAGRFMSRHRDGVAIMRCLGAVQSQVTRMLWLEFALVGLLASVVGCLLGFAVHQGLVSALGKLIDTQLPAASLVPALQGVTTGMLLLLGFALPALAQLRHVPPARVLRRDADGIKMRSVTAYGVGAAGFAVLIWWFAGDARLAGVMAGGFLGAFLIFAGVTWLCIAMLARVRRAVVGFPALRFALAGVVRRRGATITQVCALSIGLMALLLLAMTRSDLIAGWQQTLPADAPNRFLINVQPDQREAVLARLHEAGLGQVQLDPMVRGRLIARNGKPIGPDDYEESRAKRLVDREFNLSYALDDEASGRLEQGRWLRPDAAEVSLESGLAKTLNLSLGDRLSFDVAGQLMDVDVTSIRKVDWDTMQVNFFAIMSASVLRDMPQSWITSFYLPPEKVAFLPTLIREFPNITVFDVGAILNQLQSVLAEVSKAVQLLFLFTLAAGLLVLAAALSATRDERVREAAVLRALGATRRQLARAQRLELLAVGALAGGLAATGASVIAWALSSQVFDFTITIRFWPWVAGMAVGMAGAWAGGALALRGVLRTPPLLILRES